MSIKSKVLAAAATLTLVGGLGAAGALTAGSASAATPSCGSTCINIFSKQFGTHKKPNFVVDVWRQSARVGQPIILYRTANYDLAEDFSISFQGLTSDFCAAGLVSELTCLHYGGGVTGVPNGSPDLPAWEIQYTPLGQYTGLCLGVAETAFQNEGVSLQPCGVSGKTVWIGASPAFPVIPISRYDVAINGSNTNFSHPFVLTYPKNGYPTDSPRPQLTVTNQTGFTRGGIPFLGSVASNQLWSATFGVLH
jgi:hypothetical protein